MAPSVSKGFEEHGHLLTASLLHLEVMQKLPTGATYSAQIVSTPAPDNFLPHFILLCVTLEKLNNNSYIKITGGAATCTMERCLFLHK